MDRFDGIGCELWSGVSCSGFSAGRRVFRSARRIRGVHRRGVLTPVRRQVRASAWRVHAPHACICARRLLLCRVNHYSDYVSRIGGEVLIAE
jgi:hypothetical protein